MDHGRNLFHRRRAGADVRTIEEDESNGKTRSRVGQQYRAQGFHFREHAAVSPGSGDIPVAHDVSRGHQRAPLSLSPGSGGITFMSPLLGLRLELSPNPTAAA